MRTTPSGLALLFYSVIDCYARSQGFYWSIQTKLLVTIMKLNQLCGLVAAILLDSLHSKFLVGILYQTKMPFLSTAVAGGLDDDRIRCQFQLWLMDAGHVLGLVGKQQDSKEGFEGVHLFCVLWFF